MIISKIHWKTKKKTVFKSYFYARNLKTFNSISFKFHLNI